MTSLFARSSSLLLALAAAAAAAGLTAGTSLPRDLLHATWESLRSEPAKRAKAADPVLDPLRQRAQHGDVEASLSLTAHLLDRYDREGKDEALLEAAQWVDRDWSSAQFRRSNIVARLVDDHCGGPVLMWHWLCDAAE